LTISELSPEKLRLECQLDTVGCETSAELGPVEGIIGQDRAIKALKFGVEMKGKGFNVYVAGQPLTGKRPATRRYLEGVAKDKPTPPDWVYVNNFQNSYEPKALKLPAGEARVFQRNLKNFVDQARRAVPAALQSDEFVARTNMITKRSVEERNRIFDSLSEEAKQHGYAVRITQVGISIMPVLEGKPLTQEEFDSLPPAVKKKFEEGRETVRNALDKAGKMINELEVKTQEELKRLRDDSIHYSLGGLVSSLNSRYQDLPEVVQHLNDLRDDILENPELFTPIEPGERCGRFAGPAGGPFGAETV